MSFSLSTRLVPETVKSVAAGSIAAGYGAGIGTAFSKPMRIVFIQNLTDGTVMFSLDGINDHFPLPANGFLLLDVTSNKAVSQAFFIAEGTRVYVRQLDVPTTGSVYVSGFYGAES